MRVYISGPMSGYPDWNFPAFFMAEDHIQDNYPYWELVNPARNFEGRTDLTRAEYLRKDIEQLLTCDAIVLLPNWGMSRGALLEHNIATELRLAIYELIDGKLYLVESYNGGFSSDWGRSRSSYRDEGERGEAIA